MVPQFWPDDKGHPTDGISGSTEKSAAAHLWETRTSRSQLI